MISSDTFDLMMKYESEGLDEEETVKLFQDLVNTGMAWSLQGFYGRHAKRLIESGHVKLPKALEEK